MAKHNCPAHGPHDGTDIAGKQSQNCPQCQEEARLAGLEKWRQKTIILGFPSCQFARSWVVDQSLAEGIEPSAWIVRMILDAMPSDDVKAGMMTEFGK